MQTPPGWYQDPNNANTMHYWNGQQWSGHTQMAASPIPVTPITQVSLATIPPVSTDTTAITPVDDAVAKKWRLLFGLGVVCLVAAVAFLLLAMQKWGFLIPAALLSFLALALMQPGQGSSTNNGSRWWLPAAIILAIALVMSFIKIGSSTASPSPSTLLPTASSGPVTGSPTTRAGSGTATSTTQKPTTTPSSTATTKKPTTTPTPPLTITDIQSFLKSAYGISPAASWVSLCTADKGNYPYPCAIADMTLKGGVLNIVIPQPLTQDEATYYANYALNFLCYSTASAHQFAGVSRVTVTDNSGGVRGQKQATANTLCLKNRK